MDTPNDIMTVLVDTIGLSDGEFVDMRNGIWNEFRVSMEDRTGAPVSRVRLSGRRFDVDTVLSRYFSHTPWIVTDVRRASA